MKQEIISWIDSYLEGLVDSSPTDNDEYMPCYIKAEDLFNDCRAHLKVIILFIFF
jgi:hypothetical protein